MKQHITVEQRDSLTDKQKYTLAYWLCNYTNKHGGHCCVLPSKPEPSLMDIGQMIEFLDEKRGFIQGGRHLEIPIVGCGQIDPLTFCDDLWDACKEVLEA